MIYCNIPGKGIPHLAMLKKFIDGIHNGSGNRAVGSMVEKKTFPGYVKVGSELLLSYHKIPNIT
jgi:hypothetical protein